MTDMNNLEAETIEDSIEWLIKQNPDKIFEGRIVTYADPDNGVEMILDPIPNACSVCVAPPVVFRTSAILPGIANGFCENHKSAFALASREIKGKIYHWFRF